MICAPVGKVAISVPPELLKTTSELLETALAAKVVASVVASPVMVMVGEVMTVV